MEKPDAAILALEKLYRILDILQKLCDSFEEYERKTEDNCILCNGEQQREVAKIEVPE